MANYNINAPLVALQPSPVIPTVSGAESGLSRSLPRRSVVTPTLTSSLAGGLSTISSAAGVLGTEMVRRTVMPLLALNIGKGSPTLGKSGQIWPLGII
jgi:hypothetical protein